MQKLILGIARKFFSLIFRIEVKGIENFHKVKGKMIVVANHTSYLDPALIACFMPETPAFAINTFIARKALFKPFIKVCRVFEVDPTSSMTVKNICNFLKTNRIITVFPEGRISVTGSLMKVYDGTAVIADKSDAEILPVHISGTEYSLLAKKNGLRKCLFPKIIITINPAQKLHANQESAGKKRRKELGEKLYSIMCESQHLAVMRRDKEADLCTKLLKSAKIIGFSKTIALDTNNKSLTYRSLLIKSAVLAGMFEKRLDNSSFIGLMMPNSLAAVVSFFALHKIGRIPVMINFTAGSHNITSAIKTAQVKYVITSRKFVEIAGLDKEIDAINDVAKVIYLEDVASSIGLMDKLAALYQAYLPSAWRHEIRDENSPATILFTSGSEGEPKGVALSHKNILSNISQVRARVDFNEGDKLFNALPLFHSFGLTAGTLLPILSGACVYLYPSPRHFRIIPEALYDFRATIMFATDTFLKQYYKTAHPYDFSSLKYIFAGAEKLHNETFDAYNEKFGVRIMQGYGVTEASPVVAVNTALEHRKGSIGKLLPLIEARFEKVEGIDSGGRMFIKGDNIMMGYIFAKEAGVINPPQDGWHDTGDIVYKDEDGYLFIAGRLKRFAKIGGEMISLAVAEEIATKLFPENIHASLAVTSDKKGEEIILFSDCKEITAEKIHEYAKKHGITEIYLPRKVMHIDKMPLLGTGKTDYVSLNKKMPSKLLG